MVQVLADEVLVVLVAVTAADTAMGCSTPRPVLRIVWSAERRILSGELHLP